MNTLKEWLRDSELRRQTLILAGIVAVFVLVLWLGPVIAQR